MKRIIKLTAIIALLSIFGSSNYLFLNTINSDSIDPFFTLTCITTGDAYRPDYLNFLRQYLARIGIDVDIRINNWPSFLAELIAFRDYDICYMDFTSDNLDPSFNQIYNQNSSRNYFGYDISLDYDADLGTGVNEWYIQQGLLVNPDNSATRKEVFWNWQQHFMDKILPLVPTFISKTYNAYWSNLQGFNISKGIGNSWGKMSWDGSHTGQVSTNELVVADNWWSNLNPLFQRDQFSKFISDLVLDKLISIDTEQNTWPNLAEDFYYINDTTFDIICRDGIKWGIDPDGNFTNELFDVHDVYFTLYAWQNLSVQKDKWAWINDMDIIDNTTIRLSIDANKNITGQQAYAPLYSALNIDILPEHYLNQTQLVDGITPDISHPAWNKFNVNPIGTNLFEFEDFTYQTETILTTRNDCWKLNTTITSDPNLNFVERFGFDNDWMTNGIKQLRIRNIPNLVDRIDEFEQGSIDIIDFMDFPNKLDEYLNTTEIDVQSTYTNSFSFYGFNLDEDRKLGDRTQSETNIFLTKGLCLRKAIAYAIDRHEINYVIHDNKFYITDWPISPLFGDWCNPNITSYYHDLDKAREFMYYYNDYMCDGIYPNSDLKPYVITVLTILAIIPFASGTILVITDTKLLNKIKKHREERKIKVEMKNGK